jgi:hypothetical protein
MYAHDDLFAQDTDDDVWLAEVGRRRMVVLTKDDKIRTKGMTGSAQAEAFVKAFPEILRIAREDPNGGYIKGVNRKGEVRHLCP